MTDINSKNNLILSAYHSGKIMQIEISKRGVNPGLARQFKAIVNNHSEEILTAYLEGLLGVTANGEATT